MALQMDMHARLEQTMSMRLTPSQRMSLEVLQLNVQALEQHIEDELESNPMLEVKETEKMKSLDESNDRGSSDSVSEEKQLEIDHVDVMSEYFEPYINENNYSSGSSNDNEDELDIFNIIEAETVDLHDYLHQQIQYLKPAEEIKKCVEIILTHLDDRGYLNESIVELSHINIEENIEIEIWEKALVFIKEELEPVGLGASNLQECLLIQTKRMGSEFDFEVEILEKHFDELLHNRLDTIAHTMATDVSRIVEVMEFFKSLEFRPASPWTDVPSMTLQPDAYIKYDAADSIEEKGKFTISLSKKGIPELVVLEGEEYKKESLTKKEKQYIIEHVSSGKALQEAIRRRNQTLFQVINSICQNQVKFFEEGKTGLRSLQMQEIAAQLDISAATVTRTVKDKVVQTDHGLFPMKHFFSMKKVKMGGGEVNERDKILKALNEVIEEEDKGKPCSDALISKRILEKGFKVATRTISKYREMLDIPSSSKRKQF
jgi:RNA polymerase sigma-54 factor